MATALNGKKPHAQFALEQRLVREGYISLDKSWMIRMGVLDLVHERTDAIERLNRFAKEKKLNGDLLALYEASVGWMAGSEVYVGESGTLYRFLRFASWKMGLDKKFIRDGTLVERSICDNRDIVNWPLAALRTLDGGTSQWMSAAVLMGNKETVKDPPFKLRLTHEAVEHWGRKSTAGEIWELRYDKTLAAQAAAYVRFLKTGRFNFAPEQAEDYCFARAFGLIRRDEGVRVWPQLAGHESNRLDEMERALRLASRDAVIDSKDHRVVQAVAMLYKSHGMQIEVLHQDAVGKSWPEFWRFLNNAPQIAGARR